MPLCHRIDMVGDNTIHVAVRKAKHFNWYSYSWRVSFWSLQTFVALSSMKWNEIARHPNIIFMYWSTPWKYIMISWSIVFYSVKLWKRATQESILWLDVCYGSLLKIDVPEESVLAVYADCVATLITVETLSWFVSAWPRVSLNSVTRTVIVWTMTMCLATSE